MTQYETKDSGAREHFESGMQRDTQDGKPRFDLILPEGIPFEDQILTRFAALMARGAEKYEDRNWEKATGEAEIARGKASAFRHFMQWITGETDEDHAVATFFNIMLVETIQTKLRLAEEAPSFARAAQMLDEVMRRSLVPPYPIPFKIPTPFLDD